MLPDLAFARTPPPAPRYSQVRGSMNLPVWCQLLPYDELNTLIRDDAFCEALGESMETLFERSDLVPPDARLIEASDWYSERSAWLDELWQ